MPSHTGDWLAAREVETFFPEIPVVFTVDGSVAHLHIPLLLSPYGDSNHRGDGRHTGPHPISSRTVGPIRGAGLQRPHGRLTLPPPPAP